jgi:hypothetical protein
LLIQWRLLTGCAGTKQLRRLDGPSQSPHLQLFHAHSRQFAVRDIIQVCWQCGAYLQQVLFKPGHTAQLEEGA